MQVPRRAGIGHLQRLSPVAGQPGFRSVLRRRSFCRLEPLAVGDTAIAEFDVDLVYGRAVVNANDLADVRQRVAQAYWTHRLPLHPAANLIGHRLSPLAFAPHPKTTRLA